jgi:adenylate cyclase class 2
MACEIELKARVTDRGAVETRLSVLGVYGGSYTKEDRYWKPSVEGGGLPASGVRLRRETRCLPDGSPAALFVVTFKTKEKRDGIEVNEENEFTVSDEAPFCALLARAGLREAYTKKKTGAVWDVEGISAELAEVGDDRRSLGWFLELEIIADNDRPATVETARRRLFTLLSDCGLSREDIEERYYAEMLR